MDETYEWKIKLSNFTKKSYPLRRFGFYFADAASRKSYIKYWAAKMYPQGLPLEELEDKNLAPDKIREGVKAIGYLEQYKDGATKFSFRMVLIQENYDERSSESHIKCLEPKKNVMLSVPLSCLFTLRIVNQVEMTGLEDLENMTEFRKLILNEPKLEQILTATCPVWKGTHFSVTLWSKAKNTTVNINESLKNLMTYQENRKIKPIDSSGFESLSTLCSIKEEIGSWIPENHSPSVDKYSTIRFHVSEIMDYGGKPGLIIHPVKYWEKFKLMEKKMQNYGQKNLNEFGCNFEEKGIFLLAAREETDIDKNKIFKFYRGYHTGEISIAGGTHKIAFVDYLTFVWVENGNMMPLPPEYCQLPMMGGKCELLINGSPDEILMKLMEIKKQHCAGEVMEWRYQDLFPVFTIRGIKAIPQPPIVQGIDY